MTTHRVPHHECKDGNLEQFVSHFENNFPGAIMHTLDWGDKCLFFKHEDWSQSSQFHIFKNAKCGGTGEVEAGGSLDLVTAQFSLLTISRPVRKSQKK